MVYEDYRKAALKHLRTCKFIKDHLDNVTDIETKRDILRNLYYISGYVIECSINFRIYKAIYKKKTTKDIEKLFHVLNKKGKSTDGKIVRFYSKDHPPAYYKISGHNYPKYKAVLEHLLPPKKLDKMPILVNKADLTEPLSILFYSWRVIFRYQTDDTQFQPYPKDPENLKEKKILEAFDEIGYEENAIRNFVRLAEELYNELRH